MPVRTRGSEQTIFVSHEDPPGTPCELCGGNGLEPVFEHVSFPPHAPAQQQLSVESFNFERWPRQWEEGGMVHQLLEAFRVCSCPAGQRRTEAMKAREQGRAKKGVRMQA